MRKGGFDRVWPRRRRIIPARDDFRRGFIDPGRSSLGMPSAFPVPNLGFSDGSSAATAGGRDARCTFFLDSGDSGESIVCAH